MRAETDHAEHARLQLRDGSAEVLLLPGPVRVDGGGVEATRGTRSRFPDSSVGMQGHRIALNISADVFDRIRVFAPFAGIDVVDHQLAVELVDDPAGAVIARPAHVPEILVGELGGLAGRDVEHEASLAGSLDALGRTVGIAKKKLRCVDEHTRARLRSDVKAPMDRRSEGVLDGLHFIRVVANRTVAIVGLHQ